MKITVQIVIDAQNGTPPATEQVAAIARDDLTMATAGLALAEAHEVLSGIQHHLVTAQAGAAAVAARHCGNCGRARPRKDTRHIVLRTLFGTLRLDSPRFKSCPCAGTGPATVSPLAALLPERTTPELLLWEARQAALTSYGAPPDATAGLKQSPAPAPPPAALRRAHLHRHRRGHRQPGHQPPHGQEAADAMVTPRRPPAPAGPHPRPQRRPRRRLRPLVPRTHWLSSANGCRCLTSHGFSRSP